MKRRAARAHEVDDRLVDGRDELGGAARVDARGPASRSPCRPCWGRGRRRRSACSPAPAPSAIARSPSQSASSESSSPSRCSSTTTVSVPKRCSTSSASSSARALRLVGDDHDALAGGEAVGLEHRGVALDRGERLVDACARASSARSARPASRHRPLGELLRALERGRRRARAEGGDAALAQAVDEPEHERQLGADDDEVDALGRGGGRDEPVEVVDGDVEQARVLRDARVAGRAEQLDRRRGERASARTSACSRPPEPTTRTRVARACMPGVLPDRGGGRARGQRSGRSILGSFHSVRMGRVQ